jgi:phosphoribosylglycinamide formyltransferase
MIHYVISEVDRGAPLLIRIVECRVGESVEGLEGRIHDIEHEAIVEGTELAIAQLWRDRESRQAESSKA